MKNPILVHVRPFNDPIIPFGSSPSTTTGSRTQAAPRNNPISCSSVPRALGSIPPYRCLEVNARLNSPLSRLPRNVSSCKPPDQLDKPLASIAPGK